MRAFFNFILFQNKKIEKSNLSKNTYQRLLEMEKMDKLSYSLFFLIVLAYIGIGIFTGSWIVQYMDYVLIYNITLWTTMGLIIISYILIIFIEREKKNTDISKRIEE